LIYEFDLVDQLVDWEDVLDFIERAQQISKTDIHTRSTSHNSPSIVPTIPIGTSLLTMPTKNSNIENVDPIKSNKIDKKSMITRQEQQQSLDEPSLSISSKNHWVQINNICVPYIIKSQQIRYLPYEVLIDCNLFNEHEQAFLIDLTIKANVNDIETFERIVSSSSSIDFKLNHNLHLINLSHVICGMSKVVYIKLLNNQRDVNKSYKTYRETNIKIFLIFYFKHVFSIVSWLKLVALLSTVRIRFHLLVLVNTILFYSIRSMLFSSHQHEPYPVFVAVL